MEQVKQLMAAPVHKTREELDTIHTNKNRKHGRNKFHK